MPDLGLYLYTLPEIDRKTDLFLEAGAGLLLRPAGVRARLGYSRFLLRRTRSDERLVSGTNMLSLGLLPLRVTVPSLDPFLPNLVYSRHG